MPVLKQHTTTPAMKEAIVLDLGDIGAQASRIRAAAETQAAKIISDAQAKAEKIARERAAQAQESGYSEGLEAGLAEGRATGHAEALAQSAEQVRQLTAAWSQVVQEWEQQRAEMEREARQSVLDFALRAAEKIVHRVIEVDESVVIDQAAQALSLVMSGHDASVRIHPVDHPILEEAMPDLMKELSSIDHIELVDDESITPGGCVVAFGQGQIDARIETQMQRLIDMILPEPPEPGEPEEVSPPVSVESLDSQAIAQKAPDAEDAPEPIAPVYEITEQGLVDSGTDQPVIDALEQEPISEEQQPEPRGDGSIDPLEEPS